jgi:outer membrane cobalamin receptor
MIPSLRFILSAFLIAASALAHAQSSIQGKVVESTTQEPLISAQIRLMSSASMPGADGGKPTPVAQALSASDGTFVLKDIPSGSYRLVINSLGFKPVVRPVEVNDAPINLGKLPLTPQTQELREAKVVSDGPAQLNGIDRKVYDVKSDLQVQGGSGTDVLRQVPNVAIDIDGNIALRGQENVTILIDGRPASLLGMSGQNAFDRIPASSISKVETITNPGAKFQADGTGGIINIVTTKNTKSGLNGDVLAGVGTRNKYNGAVNLAQKVGETNFFLNGSWDDRQTFSTGNTLRLVTLPENAYVSQISGGLNRNIGYTARGGADFKIKSKHQFNLSAGLNQGIRSGYDTTFYGNLNKFWPDTTHATQFDTSSSTNFNWDAALRYEYKFKKENYKWTADVSFSQSEDDQLNTNTWDLGEGYPVELTHGAYQQFFSNLGGGRNLTFQTDSERPVGSKSKLDFGMRSAYFQRGTDQQAQQLLTPLSSTFLQDSLRSFTTDMNQWVHAGYATFGRVFSDQWKAQVGLRYEHAFLSFLLRDGSRMTRDFPGFFPSVYWTYSPKKGTDFQLSYSMRVNRPGQESLNPIVDYSNPQSIRKGNPDLKPENTHAFEFNAVKFSRKGSISGSVYMNNTTNMFSRYLTVESNGAVVVSWQNFSTRQRYGLSANAMGRFVPWMNLQASADAYFSTIDGGNLQAGLQQSGFGWNGRLNATVELSKIQQLQITYMQMGAGPTGQGVRKPMGGMDLGYKVDLMKRHLSISARLSDVFKTRQFGFIQDRPGVYIDFERYRESRIFFVNVQYRFGQQNNERKGRGGRQPGMPGGGGMEMMDL